MVVILQVLVGCSAIAVVYNAPCDEVVISCLESLESCAEFQLEFNILSADREPTRKSGVDALADQEGGFQKNSCHPRGRCDRGSFCFIKQCVFVCVEWWSSCLNKAKPSLVKIVSHSPRQRYGYPDITKRVGAGWRNWKKCSGVLCDRRMPVKLKGNVYLQNSDQANNAIWGRNVGSNEETRKTD